MKEISFSIYRLFQMDGTRFVCCNILYRAIDAGGRMSFNETSFNLINTMKFRVFLKKIFLPIIKVIIFCSPTPIKITITIDC